jgi:DNA-binding response OmpR family regulator
MPYTNNLLASELARNVRRVLVIDANPASARMVAELLKTLGVVNITSETTGGAAMAACAQLDPEVMVTELSGPRLNGLELVKTLRRCDLACRKIPVIMITAEATASAILAARDAGVHEFLRRPFTMGQLTKRLEAVLLHPREWVEAISYVGPDRRRFNSGDYKGPRKRLADVTQPADAERIRQALQILTSAIAAIESDPAQALRSMQAQAATLKACGVAGANMNLTMAAAKLQRALQAAVDTGRLARADIEAGASDLWAFRTGEVGEDDGNMLEL